MADKKQDSFTVTDRRLFTPEGEVRKEIAQEEVSTSTRKVEPLMPGPSEHNIPPAPSAAEQQKQADEYRKSAKSVDRRVESSGHSAKDLEMTFERFIASLYMTAMLQLGLMHEQGGEPRVDLIGARQTVDTLSMLSEKTRSNLTSVEENLLQNCLYELRMAYVEVTNALARPPQATGTDSVQR